MLGPRTSPLRRAGSASLFILLSISPSVARIRPQPFPIPGKVASLSMAPTPAEYAQLVSAIRANWEREKDQQTEEGPGLGSDFSHITAARMHLGTLGDAMLVYFANSPECGATGNCPMAVYVRQPTGYRRVINAGGWGAALLPSGGPVPDVAFYSHMSAAETDAVVFHCSNGRFAGQGGPACTDQNRSNPVCAAIATALGGVYGISPADYAGLRPYVEADLKKKSQFRPSQLSFSQMRAVNIANVSQTVVTMVGWGPCDINQDCTISIYAHPYGGTSYSPLLRNASGWGATLTFNAGNVFVVVLRKVSPTRDELTAYKVIPSALLSIRGIAPGSQLITHACELIDSNTNQRPSEWNSASLTAQPVPCFPTHAASEVQFPVADPTNVLEAVQDTTGKVWAISSGRLPELYRWNNGAWTAVSLEGTNEMRPRGLWPGPNGGALLFYEGASSGPSPKMFAWLRGDETKILGHVESESQQHLLESLQLQAVVPAPRGTILVAGDGGDFYRNGVLAQEGRQVLLRLGPNGKLRQIYSIASSQYCSRAIPLTGERFVSDAPLDAARSPDGRIWLWSHFSPLGGAQKALDGFLISDGNGVQFRQIPGLPTESLHALARWDKNHFVAAEFNDGLYTVNTTTFKIHPVREPEPGAFRFAENIFGIGSERYVLTSNAAFRLYFPDGIFNGTLWRFQHGHWQKLLENIRGVSRIGLAVPDGLWLATWNRGLLYFPIDGRAQKIDWRNGLSLASANRIFRLPDGQILTTSASSRSVAFTPRQLLPEPKLLSNFFVLYPFLALQPDGENHLWGLLHADILGEWDGKQWLQHPLPSTIDPSRLTRVDVDSRGRVWLFPNCRLGPMAIFDPAASSWSAYQDYRFALTHQTQPVAFLHSDDDPMRPIYGPNSQIVFVGPCSAVNYFDGAEWRLWRNNQLPEAAYRNLDFLPFFDHTGNLAMDIHNETWEWTRARGWAETAFEPQKQHLDPLSQIMFHGGPVRDSAERSWWVSDDSLYEGDGEDKRLMLSGSALQPFIDGRRLVRVLLDSDGNAFLETQEPFSYVILPRSE